MLYSIHPRNKYFVKLLHLVGNGFELWVFSTTELIIVKGWLAYDQREG